MSAHIINLRQARKRKKRSNKEKVAEQNRQSFGRTKAEKTLAKGEVMRLNRALDQKKLDRE